MSTGRGRKGNKVLRARREKLHAHQGGKCFWCPKVVRLDEATLDELLPRSRGGTQRWENIVMSCWHCNTERADGPAPAWAVEQVRLRGAV